MRILRLGIRGFLSFSDEEQVIKLKKLGQVLIEGENRDDPSVANNGAAKSAIIEAILWCLFGQTMRGVAADAVVHRQSVKGCRVWLEFENEKGEAFKVTRHRKDTENKNKLEFIGPRAGLTSNETSRTQETIIDVVGMDFEIATNAMVFGQERLKSFASMTDRESKSLLDRLIGIDFSDAHERAKLDLRELDAKLMTLQFLDIGELEADVEKAREQATKWNEERKAELDELKEQRSERLLVDVLKARGRWEAARQARRAGEATVALLREAWNKVDRGRVAAQVALDVAQQNKSKVDRLRGATECPTCRAPFDRGAHQRHLEELGEAVEAAETLLAGQTKEASKARLELKNAVAEVAQIGLEEQRQSSLVSEAEAFNARIQGMDRLIEAKLKEVNPHDGVYTRVLNELWAAQKSNAKMKVERRKLKEQKKDLAFVAAMLSDKGTDELPPLKSLVAESIAPFLNERLAYYAKRITGGNFTIIFETQKVIGSGEIREAYKLTAVNQFGAEDYEGASKGEKRKIDMAIFFAFQALAASRAREPVRFVVFDEVLDALDETAQEVMLNLLLDEGKKRETMLVVSQNPELQSFFKRRIKVIKQGGFSTVEQ